MADPVTTQQLINMGIDADTVEEIINSDDNTTVMTRLGRNVKSLAKTLADMANVTFTGDWTTSTSYTTQDLVMESSLVYLCIASHTSTTFVADAANWVLYAGVQPTDGIIFGTDGKKYRFICGVLRQDTQGSGWYALLDGSHAWVGLDPITPVEESNGTIVLNYGFSATKVGTLVIGTDEGYGNKLLRFDPSVGSSAAVITLYYPFWARISGTAVVGHSYFGPKGTDWDAVYNVDLGTWVFTHATESHSDNTGSTLIIDDLRIDTTSLGWEEVTRTKTGFTVSPVQIIHGRTSGETVVSDNIGVHTAAWDGTDTLRITHEQSPSAYDYSVTIRNAAYNHCVVSESATYLDVQFFDLVAGIDYVGASVPCGVTYTRGGTDVCKLTSGNRATFERSGLVKVSSAYVSGASSNLWFSGLMEVS